MRRTTNNLAFLLRLIIVFLLSFVGCESSNSNEEILPKGLDSSTSLELEVGSYQFPYEQNGGDESGQKPENGTRQRNLAINGRDLGEGWVLLMVDSESICPATRMLKEAFDSLEEVLGKRIGFATKNVTDLFHLQHEVPFDISQATVFLLKDQIIVDAHSGSISMSGEDTHSMNINSLEHLLARNGVVNFSPDEFLLEGFLAPGSWENRPIGPIDLSTQDFSDASFRRSFFSGTKLRDANLSGADLSAVTFAGADLKNALLQNANLEGSFWINTRCPDGTMSNENDFRCE